MHPLPLVSSLPLFLTLKSSQTRGDSFGIWTGITQTQAVPFCLVGVLFVLFEPGQKSPLGPGNKYVAQDASLTKEI